MDNCFRLTSLCVHIAAPSAKLEANSLLYPAGHQPKISRTVFHETVHYWQYLAFGFIAKLADEELSRLRAYETGSIPPPPGPINQEYRRHYDCVGFSALDLQESLARYWDVHVLGPVLLLELDLNDPARRIPENFRSRYEELKAQDLLKIHGGDYTDLAFDLAMEASAGNYAKPYLMLREQYPSAIAAGLFPLVGGVALMADRPAPFFVRLLRMVESRLRNITTGNIHEIWQAWYFPIQGYARQLAEELGEEFSSAVFVYQEGDLKKHVPHDFAAFERQNAINALAESDHVKSMAAERQIDAEHLALFELDRRLLLPGDPEHRAFLSYWLSPPCVRHANGERWLPSDTMRRINFPEIDETERKLRESRDKVADDVEDLDARWQRFVRASIRTHHKPIKHSSSDLPEEHAFYSAIQSLIRSAGSKHTDYGQIFFSIVSDYPVPSQELMNFFARHALLGSLRTEEIREVNRMICMQLALKSGLESYDARTGYSWSWSGQPVEMALAAELGGLAATQIGHDELKNECTAVLLRSLDAFLIVTEAKGVDALMEKILNMRHLLQKELAQQEALAKIDAVIDNYTKETA